MNIFEEYNKLGLVEKKRFLSKDELKAFKALSIKDRPKNIIKVHTIDGTAYCKILEVKSREEQDEIYRILKFTNEKKKTSAIVYARNFFSLAFFLLITGIVIYTCIFLFMTLPNLS